MVVGVCLGVGVGGLIEALGNVFGWDEATCITICSGGFVKSNQLRFFSSKAILRVNSVDVDLLCSCLKHLGLDFTIQG